MKIFFQVEIELDERAGALRGPNWFEGAISCAEEFGSDLGDFISQHPFIIGCKMQKPAIHNGN